MYVTVPLPFPLDPPLTVIHETLLVAVQPQPCAAVTATLPAPTPLGYVALAGEMAYVQGTVEAILLTLPPRLTT